MSIWSHNAWKIAKLVVAYTFLVLLLFVMVIGCDNDSSSNDPDVAGLVVDEPLSGAEVKIFGPNNSTPLGSTITGNSGQFSFNLPKHDYYLLKSKGGEFENGTKFNGTMKGIYLYGENVCSISPLSSLAVNLYKSEDYDLTPREALREAKRAMDIEPDLTDPFFLQAYANETVKRDLEKIVQDTGNLTDELRQVQIGHDTAPGKPEFQYRAELNHLRRQIDTGDQLSQWVDEMKESIPKPFYNNTAGQIQLDKMLIDASVSMVKNGQSKKLATTDSNGHWQSASKMKILEPFRLKVSGGITDAGDTAPFNGTLSAYVPYRHTWHLDNGTVDLQDLNVNILTTVIDRYMQYSDITYYTARSKVKSFFNIPEDVDPTKIDNSNYNYSFFPSEFMKRSQKHSDFDSYVDSLVMQIDTDSSVKMTPPVNMIGPGSSVARQVVEKSVGATVFDGIVGGMGSGAASFALNTAMKYALPAVGMETQEQKRDRQFREIKAKLDEIKAKLDEIKGQLDTVNDKLDSISEQNKRIYQEMVDRFEELYNQIEEVEKKIMGSQIFVKLDNIYNDIDNDYERYQIKLQDLNSTNLNSTDLSHDLKQDLKDDWADMYDNFNDLYKWGFNRSSIKKSMMENMVSFWTDKIKQADNMKEKGELLKLAYNNIKMTYNTIITKQWYAATLYINHKVYNDATEDSVFRDFIERKIPEIIKKETHEFIKSVEKLVTASANIRTELVKGKNMFPKKSVREVFKDADLMAQQILSNDQAGFITRVVGTPEATQYDSPDQSRSKIERVSDFGKKTRISIDGEKIRGYDAPTEDYPSDYYLSFSSNEDSNIDRNVKYAKNIFFTKFYFEKVNNTLNDLLQGMSRLNFTWDLVYSDPAYYADTVEFNALSSTVPKSNETKRQYGHITIFARNLPELHKYLSASKEEKNGDVLVMSEECNDNHCQVVHNFKLNYRKARTKSDMRLDIRLNTQEGTTDWQGLKAQVKYKISQSCYQPDVRRRVSLIDPQTGNWDLEIDERLDISYENNWNKRATTTNCTKTFGLTHKNDKYMPRLKQRIRFETDSDIRTDTYRYYDITDNGYWFHLPKPLGEEGGGAKAEYTLRVKSLELFPQK